MRYINGKTPEGLVKHAEKALDEHWWYVWGTFGNKLTKQLLEAKAKQYPLYNAGINKYVHETHIGETVSDCVGLIKGYCMWNDLSNKPVYKSYLDYNTGMMYNASKVKGPIGTIPNVPGVCTYMQGHVGVYIGDGWVIECAGGRGAIKTPLSGEGATRWTNWFECPFIDYDAPDRPLKVGDRVKLKGNPKDYNGKRLAIWVPLSEYDIIELKNDRAVIAKNDVIVAAMNVNDLTRVTRKR